jgi:hypothetical protein
MTKRGLFGTGVLLLVIAGGGEAGRVAEEHDYRYPGRTTMPKARRGSSVRWREVQLRAI